MPAAPAAEPPAHHPGVRLVGRLFGERIPRVLHEEIARLVPPGTAIEDLRPYYEACRARGLNPWKLAWLREWADQREIPPGEPGDAGGERVVLPGEGEPLAHLPDQPLPGAPRARDADRAHAPPRHAVDGLSGQV